LALTSGVRAADPLKAGFIYVSPIGDAGWTYQHDLGRKEMEKALAGKVTTKFIENVPEGADAERVIRELAHCGNQVIFATSFGYMNYGEGFASSKVAFRTQRATRFQFRYLQRAVL
jgi:simple sugar transport system substrate-binding protein